MTNLIYLLKLLQQLDRSEIRILKRSFDLQGECQGKKQLEFLEILLDNFTTSESTLSRKLKKFYDTAKTNYHTRCLIERVYDLMLMDATVNRRDNYSEITKATILVKKRVLQIQILWGKRHLDRLPLLMSQTEKMASEFELLDDLVELIRIRQEFFGLRMGLKYYNELEAEIKQLSVVSAQIKRSKLILNGCMLSPANARDAYLQPADITAVVNENLRVIALRPYKHLHYYNCLLQLELCQINLDHQSARDICLQLEDLVTANPMLFPKERLGGIYLQQAYNALHVGEVQQCKAQLAKARPLISHSEMNNAIADELTFVCAFFSNELLPAENLLINLMDKGNAHLPADHADRLPYYLACLHFKKKEFTKALKVIQGSPKFKAQNSDWDTGFRFLKLMVLIELNAIDAVDPELESLRKHLEKSKKGRKYPSRWDMVFALLKQLNRSGFNFKQLVKEASNKIVELASEKPDCRWMPTGSELIPIHVWLLEKANVLNGFSENRGVVLDCIPVETRSLPMPLMYGQR